MIVKLPDGRQLNVQTNDPKAASLAAKKFLAKEQAGQMVAKTSPGLRTAIGAADTFGKAVPFLDEVQALAPTAGYMLQGNPVGNSWRRARADQDAYAEAYAKEHPVAAPLTTGAGYGAQVLPAVLSGGASAEGEVAPAARGLFGKLVGMAKAAPKNATIGGLYAALNGLAGHGTAEQRLHAANDAVVPGAAVGVALPAAVGAAADAVDAVGAKAAPVVTAAKRVMTRGSATPDQAARTAAQRLSAALLKDGATPDILRTAMNGFLKNGATDPTLLDVAARLPNGGQNTMALVRGSAAKGPAAVVAKAHATQTGADLQDKAIAHTKKLSPDVRPAQTVAEQTTKARDAIADTEYKTPYQTPIDARPVLDQLQGDVGRRALNHAASREDAHGRLDAVDEITALRDAAHPPPPTAGDLTAATPPDPMAPVPTTIGALDRAKRALNFLGSQEADPVRAAGHHARAEVIDNYLADMNEPYRTARDNFARTSAAIKAIDLGHTGMTAAPDEFSLGRDDLVGRGGDLAQQLLRVGHTQELIDAIGKPKEDALTTLDRIASATNQGRNLTTSFGPDAAEGYQGGLTDLADQARNAKLVAPKPAVADEADPLKVARRLNAHTLVKAGLDKLNAGALLTPEEQTALVQMALSRTGADGALSHFSPPEETPPPPLRVFLPALTQVMSRAAAAQTGSQRPNQ